MYEVKAIEHGRVVCEVGSIGGIQMTGDAVAFARSLRQEFPRAIVAILPYGTRSLSIANGFEAETHKRD